MNIEIRTRNLKNGNKSLYLDIYDKGERAYETLQLYLVPEVDDDAKRLNKNAMQKALAVKSERMLGVEAEAKPLADKDMATTMSLLDAIHMYINEKIKAASCSDNHIRSVRTMKRLLTSYIQANDISEIRLIEVDKRFVQNFLAYLRDTYRTNKAGVEGSKLSPSTQFTQQSQFATFLGKMHKRGMIASNPFGQLDAKERLPKPITMRDALTASELTAMFEVETGSPVTKQAFIFCCFTGLRYCDVASLTWGDICKTPNGLSIFLLQRKTKKYTSIPLGERAMQWLPDRGARLDEDLVFTLSCLASCDRALKHMAKNAGITKRVSFHTARHTFATLAFEAGGELLTVSKLLGHTNVKTTQRYAEVKMEAKVGAVNLVSGLFG